MIIGLMLYVKLDTTSIVALVETDEKSLNMITSWFTSVLYV